MEVVTLQTMYHNSDRLLHLGFTSPQCCNQLQCIYCMLCNTSLLVTTIIRKTVTNVNFLSISMICVKQTNLLCKDFIKHMKWQKTQNCSNIEHLKKAMQFIWCLCTTAVCVCVAFSLLKNLLHCECKKHCTSSNSSGGTADCCKRRLCPIIFHQNKNLTINFELLYTV